MSETCLKFSKGRNVYTGFIAVEVDAEIFRNSLYKYLTDNNIDPANIEEYQKALAEFSRISRWTDHPRAHKSVFCPSLDVATMTPPPEDIHVPVPDRGGKYRLSQEEKSSLENKLISGNFAHINELLTPIPANGDHREKQPVYDKRYAEKSYIRRFCSENNIPFVSDDRLSAIASAVNGTRIK